MRCTVVIPNFNGSKYIRNCLTSLENEINRSVDEVIVVDNASTDDSLEIIQSEFNYINVINLDENYGFSRAVNEGIYKARGKYIILLNNDTEVCEGWLSNLLVAVEAEQNIFSVSSKMIQLNDKELIDDAGDALTVLGWAFKRGDGKKVNQYCKKEEIFSSCAGAAIYRKSIFEHIGYFDENFFAYLEDVDIGYRAKIFGYKNVYCPGANVYHVGSATSGDGSNRLNSFKVTISARNNIYLIYKNMPYVQLLLNLPMLLVGWLVKLFTYSRKGFLVEYLKGTLEGIYNLRNIQRVNHKMSYLKRYISIQLHLLQNTFIYCLRRFI